MIEPRASKPIYLDYNATTPVDPAVVEAMLPYLEQDFGNPSSVHVYGKLAQEAVQKARRQVADLLGASPEEIVFTGGGTEASNHAIKGALFAQCLAADQGPGLNGHVITSAIEHPATWQPCTFLKRFGCNLTILPVDHQGLINLDQVREALHARTTLITVMHSNNEVGTLQPIREIATLGRELGVLIHTDAAQSVGKVPVNVRELGVDLLSLAGHKLYAPKGIGALYVRRGVKLESLVHGAGHELGRRAGTENVPYIVGLGAACALAQAALPKAAARLRALRDRLWHGLQAAWQGRLVLNGHPDKRLPNTLNVNFPCQSGAELLEAIPEIAASTGSACHEGSVRLSPVLQAMGVPPELGKGAIRLSVGRFTTEEEIDRAVEAFRSRAMFSPA